MKKTIAILLILVIGMVGAFADGNDATDTTAKVTLTTEIFPINEMVITDVNATEAGWKTYSAATTTTTTENGEEVTTHGGYDNYKSLEDPVAVDAFSSALQSVAKLWSRSNNRVGYKIYIEAAPLKAKAVSGATNPNLEKIHYVVYGGVNSYDTTLSSTYGDDGVVYVEQIGAPGLIPQVKTIMVHFGSEAAGVSADVYSGDITFTFKAN